MSSFEQPESQVLKPGVYFLKVEHIAIQQTFAKLFGVEKSSRPNPEDRINRKPDDK